MEKKKFTVEVSYDDMVNLLLKLKVILALGCSTFSLDFISEVEELVDIVEYAMESPYENI